MALRKTWREKATASAITRKTSRRRDPVTTYTQLAYELGAPVYPNHFNQGGPAVSSSFRTHVREVMGGEVFTR